MISSACFTSSNNVSPEAVFKTGTRAGRLDISKSLLSCSSFKILAFRSCRIIKNYAWQILAKRQTVRVNDQNPIME